MAEISAAAVMKLRKLSGQGMMDCKQALQEADGNSEKALEILRKKGMSTLAKRSDRETTQGLVVTQTSADGKTVVLATLCCETDFVAKNEDFVAASQRMLVYAMACAADQGAEALARTAVAGKTYSDVITELVSKTGEKTEVGDYAKFKLAGPGLIGVYVHFNRKVGSMVLIETSDDKVACSDGLKQVGLDVAMHITAAKPLALDKDGVDPMVVEQERAIYAEQVKGKPEQMVSKIVEGKLAKFYAENCLVQQPFVKDDKRTVLQVVADAAKQAGGTAQIKRFVRFEVGS